jgi:polyhydroxyalkanoate synthase
MIDRRVHASLAQATAGLSPVAMAVATIDWALHLATSPGAAMRLMSEAHKEWIKAALPPADGEAAITDDARFADPVWNNWPYSQQARAFKATERWWQQAVRVRGVQRHHSDVVSFFAQQWLNMLSPSNWPWSNPVVQQATVASGGSNLLQGWQNWSDDQRRRRGEELPVAGPALKPGVDLALTPGQVVHRNALIELIQYTPTTKQVQSEPVLIVPSWIMKYYILDLSPHNSMVKWLVDQGHTVYMLSWRNPDEGDALLSMADYLELGVFDALAAVGRLTQYAPVHAVGYCLGGTLLSIAAAALARPRAIDRVHELPALAGVTLFAAETDFTEPGQLGVLIDADQVELLEDVMTEKGFLTGPQMAGAFQFLNSRDLVWAQPVKRYLLGEQEQPNDLMAWNADLTRMPATMHSEYLKRLYLNNELADGRYPVEGHPVSLRDIRQPMFVVGTVKDHVAPWKSVYKLARLTDTEFTFALASGGHNAGIVSEPGHPKRSYQLLTTDAGAPTLSPEEWLESAPKHEGSWWTAWHAWLVQHSEGKVAARPIDAAAAIEPAPGSNVHVRYRDA